MTVHTISGAHYPHRQLPALMLALSLWATAVGAQTTTFTYQGQLTDGDTGANGNYDLQFALFDTAAAGTQFGATQTVPAVVVTNGLFTVQLDFGVNAFPGANRLLEIGVRPAGGDSFTTLTPRQQISSAPYAIRTLSAATADALSSTCTGCVQDSQIQSVAGSKVSGTIPVASVPAGSGNYIQNTTTEQSNANFNISGNGVIDGDLSVNDLTVNGALDVNLGGLAIENRTTQQPNANFNISGNGTAGGTIVANAIRGVASTGGVVAVHGESNTNRGVEGVSNSGIGVIGIGTTRGVVGTLGVGTSCAGTYAVGGCAGTSAGIGVMGESTTRGVVGTLGGTSCAGTYAVGGCAGASGGIGVHGASNTNRAVEGLSGSGIGVIGDSSTRGVVGTLGGTSCAGVYAVGGCAGSTVAAGVFGRSAATVAVLASTDTGDIFRGVTGAAETPRARINALGRGFFNGGTQTSGADYAESIPASDDSGVLEPGDVLALDPQRGFAVRQSREPNSRLLAGVYSTRPALLAVGEHGIDDSLGGEVPVAVLGVVPTKVTDENGPLQIGDLLVTSSVPGRAMKAHPEVINGVMVYPTGAILGKALEPLVQGTGVIKVLVMLR